MAFERDPIIELKILKIIKTDGEIKGGTQSFVTEHQDKFAGLHRDIFFGYLKHLRTTNVVDPYDDKYTATFDNYLESIQKKVDDINKANQHEANQQKLSRWQVIVFWPVFIFGILGGVYAIYDFITELSSDKPVTIEQLDDYVKKDELKQTADTTKTN